MVVRPVTLPLLAHRSGGAIAVGPALILAASLAWGPAVAQPAVADAAPGPGAESTARPSPDLSPEAQAAWQEAQSALARQDWVQAELWLERTLMLSPEHAESLIQLVLVLLHRGRTETAQALIAALEADPRTPADQRARLAQLRLSAVGSILPGPDTPARTTVQVGLGRSSNPLALTGAREIRLTLPEGDVFATLSQRPQPAAIASTEVTHQAANGSQWGLQLRRSDLPDTATAWRLRVWAPLGQGDAATPAAASQWALQLGAQRDLDHSARANLQLIHRCADAPDTGTVWLCGLGWFDENNGRRGLLVRALRTQTAPRPAARWPWPSATQAWAEADILRHATQPNQVRLGAQLAWQLAPHWQLLGALQWQSDTSGYSPLLANGARRRLLTGQIVLQWRLPIDPSVGQWTLQLASTRRHANLPLFAWREHNVQLLWQRTLPNGR